MKFWWLGSYQVVCTNSEKSNYNIAELNNTEKSERVSELRLKLYLLRCNAMLHNYQQRIDTHMNVSSDFDSDSDDDHVQYDPSASLIDR